MRIPIMVAALTLLAGCGELPTGTDNQGPLRATTQLPGGTSVVTGTGVPHTLLSGTTLAAAVSNAGHVVGMLPTETGFVWHAGTLSTIALPAGWELRPHDVNLHGDVVGIGFGVIPTFRTAALLVKKGVTTILPDLGGIGMAVAINDRGDVAGAVTAGLWQHPALWRDGALSILALPAGTQSGAASALNERGEVVGVAGNRGVLWRDGGFTLLPMPATASHITVNDINESGHVVGSVSIGNRRRAFVWTGGDALTELPAPEDGHTEASAINDAGQIVGFHLDPFVGRTALLWTNGRMLALSAGRSSAQDINDAGEVAGTLFLDHGSTGVVWHAADVTPPVITFTGARAYTIDETLAVTCTATDEGAGIATQDCPSVSGDAWLVPLGTYTLTATATDNMGNTATATAEYSVVFTVEGLRAVTWRCVEHPGIAKSLDAKLSAGAFDAFANEVEAQAGKAIGPVCAEALARLAREGP